MRCMRFLDVLTKRMAEGAEVDDVVAGGCGVGGADSGGAAGRWSAAGDGGATVHTGAGRRLTNTLHDREGTWVLGARDGGASEFALTSWGERRSSVRLDRMFRAGDEPVVAGTECLWIVDYKTASHGRAGSRSFCRGEGEVWAADGGLCADDAD